MPRKISIIIPIHNSIEYTKNALRDLYSSLKKVSDPAWQFEVVVVDDGSDDGSGAWIKDQYPDVHLCQGNGELWWSGSVNLGMDYAIGELGSDFIIWWNNDIYPAVDYFTNLLTVLSDHTDPVVLGSKIYVAGSPDHVWSYGGYFHRRWGHSFMVGNSVADGPEFSQPKEVDWLAGMGTIIPGMIVNKVGRLNDADFPQYHGDIDYTYRAKLAGYKVQVRPELKIWNYTEHSGLLKTDQAGKLISGLRRKNSIHNFRREWLLYRKYARTPLAYLVLFKKYVGYLLRGK
jgi:GT2 family glycosyltransferase